MEDIIKMEIEYENSRMENPNCLNCRSMYLEYGMHLCKKNDECMEDLKDKCEFWN